MINNIGIQLYSLKEETAKDFVGALEKVSEIGFDGVEFAGYGGISSSEMKKHLHRLGLKAVGSHVGFELLKNNLDSEIEYALTIGNKYIVCPYAKAETLEEVKSLGELLSKIGEKVKTSGLQLCYHNHGHEFKTFDGEYGLDILFKSVPSDILMTEIDTYWVKYAGIDPVQYIMKYPNRSPLLHLKDMEKGEGRKTTEVGSGLQDFKAIITAAEQINTEWLIIEQEHFNLSYFESIKQGLGYIKKI